MKKKVIMFIIILTIFTASLIGYNLINNNKNNNKQKNNVTEESEDMTIIDFNNTDNAKIEDEKKINTSQEIIKEHKVTYDSQEPERGKDVKTELLINNVSLYADTSETHFSFKLTNNNDFDISYASVNIAFLDSRGKYIYSFERNIHDLSAHNSIDLTVDDTIDYANAKTIEIIVG